VRRIQIRFLDVTTVSVALLDLKDALDRQRCPDIAPLIDGTITPVDRSKKPFFVVSEVVYGGLSHRPASLAEGMTAGSI
jgi:hypothetical protein